VGHLTVGTVDEESVLGDSIFVSGSLNLVSTVEGLVGNV
jgi:hypothetical protein